MDKINIQIKKGEFVVLKGNSGSGKTTLINLLSSLIRPTKGEIKVDGVNLDSIGKEWRSKLGYATQMAYYLMET